MLSNKNVKVLKLMRRLKSVDTLYQIMGYEKRWRDTDAFNEATHYFTVKDGNVSDPSTTTVTQIQRPLSENVVETFFIIANDQKSEEWYLVTDWPHSKPNDGWGHTRHNAFRHLKQGELVFFVRKQPIPDKKFKLTPFRTSLYY